MLKTLWLVLLISGIVSIFIGIILMIIFRVPYLIGEVNGKNAEKQIKYLRGLSKSNTTNNLFIDSDSGSIIELPIKEFEIKEEVQKDNTYILNNDSTGFMQVESDSTALMQEDDSTTILYSKDVPNQEVRHSVILIKEQTSLNINI